MKVYNLFIYLFIFLGSLRELHTPKTNESPLAMKIPNQMIMKMKKL
jgi:hypothetical protein